MTDHVSTHQAEEDVRNAALLFWLNGRIVPRAEAVVSIYDSGFMLGDGVWEGVRLYDGRWTFLDDHMERLFEGKVFLEVFVKVKSGWTDDERLLKSLGYE